MTQHETPRLTTHPGNSRLIGGCLVGCAVLLLAAEPASAQKRKPAGLELKFPPQLTGGAELATDSSELFLKGPAGLRAGVTVAKSPPVIDFAYFPGQSYAGKPWSAWGDSTLANGKYYASIGDHLAPGGSAFVYEYDPATRKFRRICDVRRLLQLPEDHYTPGKIHTQLGMGSDGWLYFGTHRGSTRATRDAPGYRGDWIIRCRPDSGDAEVVAEGPVPRHCIPTGLLDRDRLIFYGGTAPPDSDADGIRFFAYDLKARKLIYSGPDGPSRALILARSTGRVYYVPASAQNGLMRFDPAGKEPKPERLDLTIGLRAASEETADGIVYTVAHAQRGEEPTLFAFHTRTEKVETLGPAWVGTNSYITSLDVDATGRFLYYIPGAHGGADADGSAVVQYDVRNRTRKVIAFLHPFYKEKYGVAPVGTYSVALSPKGDALYVTWNSSRGGKVWDVVALSVIHIPQSER